MTKGFLIYGVVAVLFLAIADFRGLIASQLLWPSRVEQKGGATSRGFFHK